MTNFTDNLWSDLMREHRSTLADTQRPQQSRLSRLHPRALAGSSLGLAGVGAALVLALSGSSAAPALAVTQQQDGSVLVKVNTHESGSPWLQAANEKLTALGTGEQIMVGYARGAAPSAGAVSCAPMRGTNAPSGPPVKVLLGTNGTQVIADGSTGAGTAHLTNCEVFKTPVTGGGNSGNTGAN